MYSLLMGVVAVAFILFVTLTSYRLGVRKTENPRLTAMVGFVLSFFPPLALIYLAVLLFKEDTGIV
ncbi:hypothetical protein LJ739_08285 [Aestuariibacter halophilus]|uniref:Uncharacterized protein n=1 Tax=Fluctibacter halophilus TaxID=226011 RepID=A0ABS8G6R0_9ALTE|nr:hypothetical protein [Aestuariibacter halophilus]MCC2616235.1 hypothetical protein [Aestuariibacter halophilus]